MLNLTNIQGTIMKKLNTKGFGAVEAVLIFVIVGMIGFVGWYVLHSKSTQTSSSTQTTNTTTTEANNPYADWQTYKDNYVTFKYPKDWTAKKQYDFADPYGAYSLDLVAPVDSSLIAADPSNKNLYLGATILIAKNGKFKGNCAGCGKVSSAEKISTNGTNGYIIIAESGVPNEPAIIDLVKDTIAVGTASYEPTGVAVGDTYNLRVSGDYRVKDGTLSLVGFKDVKTIKNSSEYIQLTNLVKTIAIQAGNLPK